MRVIGGSCRGRRLAEFPGGEVRPTADRTRESLFNILAKSVPNSVFLDAFCGSGAVGIEALSRGAAEVVFTDASRQSALIAQKNISTMGFTASVLVTEAQSYLKRTDKRFDIIFLDPPYASSAGVESLAVIGAGAVLSDGGTVVYEHDSPFTGGIDGLIKTDERKYGRAYLTFFKKEQ